MLKRFKRLKISATYTLQAEAYRKTLGAWRVAVWKRWESAAAASARWRRRGSTRLKASKYYEVRLDLSPPAAIYTRHQCSFGVVVATAAALPGNIERNVRICGPAGRAGVSKVWWIEARMLFDIGYRPRTTTRHRAAGLVCLSDGWLDSSSYDYRWPRLHKAPACSATCAPVTQFKAAL